MTVGVSPKSLGDLAGRVAVPHYDRGSLRAGIVHFGIGNFHRAHQAVYIDDLNAGDQADGWGIVGAGVRQADEATRLALLSQDYLYTVVEQDAETSKARVIGSLIDYLPVGDSGAAIARLADPAVAIVSLTVTEGGYYIDEASGRFDADHTDIVADISSPETPRTAFGMIAAGLAARRKAGAAPFAIMSCDNIPHNGVVTANAVIGIARAIDPGLGDWIGGNVAFPNGMVDRITPATGQRERDLLASDFGIEDARPVYCETFRQWILEDTFPAGRPSLENAGVQFVSDVTPYEGMKIRILNGGHAILAYAAGLLGIEFVHDAATHPLIRAFLERVETNEIIPNLPPAPGIDFADYYASVAHRFSNPKVGDTVRRIAFDGSNRQPKFIVPSIDDALAAGRPFQGLALESALWCRYCQGTAESGKTIAANDPNWDALTQRAAKARSEPAVWLQQRDVYGDLATAEAFTAAFSEWLDRLWSDGVEPTIRRYLEAAA